MTETAATVTITTVSGAKGKSELQCRMQNKFAGRVCSSSFALPCPPLCTVLVGMIRLGVLVLYLLSYSILPCAHHYAHSGISAPAFSLLQHSASLLGCRLNRSSEQHPTTMATNGGLPRRIIKVRVHRGRHDGCSGLFWSCEESEPFTECPYVVRTMSLGVFFFGIPIQSVFVVLYSRCNWTFLSHVIVFFSCMITLVSHLFLCLYIIRLGNTTSHCRTGSRN